MPICPFRFSVGPLLYMLVLFNLHTLSIVAFGDLTMPSYSHHYAVGLWIMSTVIDSFAYCSGRAYNTLIMDDLCPCFVSRSQVIQSFSCSTALSLVNLAIAVYKYFGAPYKWYNMPWCKGNGSEASSSSCCFVWHLAMLADSSHDHCNKPTSPFIPKYIFCVFCSAGDSEEI